MTRSDSLDRRQVLTAGAFAAGFTIVPRHVLGGPGHKAPSETLNVAAVGLGGIGTHDVKSLAATENIVALCDVDRNMLDRHAKLYEKAKRHTDYRKMLDTQKDIDAVLVATPDHLHAVVSMAAIRLGKHVHCQKPLTHSAHEARALGQAAKAAKVATQMGNYGQATEEHRLMAELIWAGAVGQVREVHAGSNRYPPISPRGIPRPKDTPPVPETLDWDLWVGPAPMRPYNPAYHPFSWRGWWDFGSGVLGDIACHELSPVFKALKLDDRHPDWVEACSSNHQLPPEVGRESAPVSSVTRWHFPARWDRPEVLITWWDGGLKPRRPDELEPNREFAENDWMMISGDRGTMLRHQLVPERRAKEFGAPPRVLPRSPGHYVEWINACKGGPPAGSNFPDHAAHLTEVVQLGNIALRTRGRLHWDPEKMVFTNSDAATALVRPPYRCGWSL